MAIEGAYNAQQFSAGRPDALSWQQHMMYWDTQNPFSAGTRGVSGNLSGTTNLPAINAPRAKARPVNMLGNPRNLSFGGRNYGTQQIDRNEWQRLGKRAEPVARQIGRTLVPALVDRWKTRNMSAQPTDQPSTRPVPQPYTGPIGFGTNAPAAPTSNVMNPQNPLEAANQGIGKFLRTQQANRPASNFPNPQDPLEAANRGISNMLKSQQSTLSASGIPTPGETGSNVPGSEMLKINQNLRTISKNIGSGRPPFIGL